MAGRRRLRAASTSTVATVDEDAIRFQKEHVVLKPAHPPDEKLSDNWPCFLLEDATVYNSRGEIASILHIDFEGPYVIRGRLNIEQDQVIYRKPAVKFYLKKRPLQFHLVPVQKRHIKDKSAWIEIPTSTSYSIGVKDDDIPVIWAQGNSGWFEISPSDKYTPTVNNMFEAVTLHYNILAQYEAELERAKDEEKKKPGSKQRKLRFKDIILDINNVLFSYAVAVGDGVTYEEAIQRCKVHALFLLSQFPKHTQFYNWLSGEVPDVLQRVNNKLNLAAAATKAEPEGRASRQRTADSDSVEPKPKRKGKTVASHPAPRSLRSSQQVESPVVDLTSDDQKPSRTRPNKGKQRSTPDTKANSEAPADVEMHDFAQTEMALRPRSPAPLPSQLDPGLPTLLDVLNEERAKILEDLGHGKAKKHPDKMNHGAWQTKVYMACKVPNYSAKEEIFTYYAKDLARSLGPEWHKSALYKWAKDDAKSRPALQHITEENILALTRRQKAPERVKPNPSTPTVAETSGKVPIRSGRPSGKAAGLRPSLGGKKRPRGLDSDDGMEFDDGLRVKKTAKTSEFFTGSENHELDDSATSEDENLEGSDTPTKALTRIAIHAERIPSVKAHGPNQTWTCQEPDCDYLVRSADEREGQDLIREHFDAHEKEASDEAKERELSKINLAMAEGQRGHMPIKYAYFPPFLIQVYYPPAA
ncbi:hypothetical protein PG994_009183 [Apiospora phragmitis]|uniref:DNA (cytosine-5)-methyltransferase 1 replication foci domain-containing protein n=1 Tax=Apiospora phragmitis TaxID=2905665 RepID=A0ABR1UIK5_9PEZI